MSTTVIVESLRLDLFPGELLRLSGALDTDAARAVVRERLERLHWVIPHHEHRAFRVDVRRLMLVNSASIRLFVDWVARAKEAEYKLVFEVDRSITWHRLTFAVLESLAPEWVEIAEHGAHSERTRSQNGS